MKKNCGGEGGVRRGGTKTFETLTSFATILIGKASSMLKFPNQDLKSNALHPKLIFFPPSFHAASEPPTIHNKSSVLSVAFRST